jgi:hypothetical protein
VTTEDCGPGGHDLYFVYFLLLNFTPTGATKGIKGFEENML